MLTIIAMCVAAQAQPQLEPLPDTAAPSAADLAGPPRSIYEVHWAIDVPVIAVGAAIGAVRLLGTEKLLRPKCPCDPASVNAFDRGVIHAHDSSLVWPAHILLGVVMAAPVILDAIDLGFTRPFLEDLIVFVETLAVDTAFQAGTALIAQRPRPRSYAGEAIAGRGEGYASFYAGHVATVVAAGAFVAQTLSFRHGVRVWPWLIPVALGAGMAVLRVGSGDHFPTDVIVGALAGLAVGIVVPWLHHRAPVANVRLVPANGGLGVAGMF